MPRDSGVYAPNLLTALANSAASARTSLGLAAIASSGSGADLTANSVTYAKLPAMTAAGLLGANAAGAVGELSATAARTILGLAAIATSGSASDLSAGTVPAARMPAHTGDVTSTAGTVALSIANGSITYAKMQNVTAARLLGNATGAAAAPAEISLAGGLAFSGTTLTAAGALTPTSVASSGAITSSGATAGIGYATGAGGAATQATSKSTGVTLSKMCGQISMNAASVAASTAVSFTLTNSAIAATDEIDTWIVSGATTGGSYLVIVDQVAAGSCRISVRNLTAGALAEAIVIGFSVKKAVAA